MQTNIFEHTGSQPEVKQKFRFGHVLDLSELDLFNEMEDIVTISGGPLWTGSSWDDSSPETLFSIWIVARKKVEVKTFLPHQVHIWYRDCHVVDLNKA